MKPFLPSFLRLALFLGAACFCASARAQTAPDAPVDRPLYDVLENLEGMPFSAVRLIAAQQADATLGPLYRNVPPKTPFYTAFDGTFIPARNSTRLAIFSDDGCNVYLDGTLVHEALDRGQHLPALSQSLHPIATPLVAGHPYNVRVEYSNTIYKGTTDADGATLFAYTYDQNENRPYVDWLAGQPISCAGIRWPAKNMRTRSGLVGTLSAFAATDWDVLQRISEGVTTSRDLSDPCTYTWTASGGSFLAANGSFSGTSGSGAAAQWRAPVVSAPTTVTITLVVDDPNAANMGTGESGSRNDALRGFNDDPLRFQVTLQVDP